MKRMENKLIDEKIEEVADPNMTMYQGAGGEADEDIYQDFKVTLLNSHKRRQNVSRPLCHVGAGTLHDSAGYRRVREPSLSASFLISSITVLAMMHEEKGSGGIYARRRGARERNGAELTQRIGFGANYNGAGPSISRPPHRTDFG